MFRARMRATLSPFASLVPQGKSRSHSACNRSQDVRPPHAFLGLRGATPGLLAGRVAHEALNEVPFFSYEGHLLFATFKVRFH